MFSLSSSDSSSNYDSDASSSAPSESPRYIVESVVSRRTNPITGVKEYLVKWANSDEKTWEPKQQLVEDGLTDELDEFDQGKRAGDEPLRNTKRAQLLGKLFGRRSADIGRLHPDVVKFSNVSTATNTTSTTSTTTSTPFTPATDDQQPTSTPLTSSAVTQSVPTNVPVAMSKVPQEPDPFHYCTPRRADSPPRCVPTFEGEGEVKVKGKIMTESKPKEKESVTENSSNSVSAVPFRPRLMSTAMSSSPERTLAVGRSPGKRSASGQLKTSKKKIAPSPGHSKTQKNQLFATSEHARIFKPAVASFRPRSISSEGLLHYRHLGQGETTRNVSSSSSSISSASSTNSTTTSNTTSNTTKTSMASTASTSSFLSPARRDFLLRRPNAIRSPGGHLLTSFTPQPSSIRMIGNKRRFDHGLKRGSTALTKRILKDDRNKFVRVVTPLKKRMKREASSSQDMTESQLERKKEFKDKQILFDSPSNHL